MAIQKSKTKNLILNVGIGYIAQIITLVLQFVGRKVFLANLPVEYLGINGLFANILSVLTLAELGADAAFVYALYKPLGENNRKQVYSLLRYFRKVYFGITVAVYVCGIALVPFLKYIINFDNDVGITVQEYTIYYILYLTNTAVTYLAAHCTTLLKANQDDRVIRIATLVTQISMQILHMVVLYLWKSFDVYLCVSVITTVVNTIIITCVTKRRYKAYFVKQEKTYINKSEINQKVISTFLYKIGAILVNNITNILISVLVSTTVVGLYSNYCTITTAVQGLIAILSTSLLSGLGHMFTKEDIEQQKTVFSIQLLMYHLIGALGGIGFGLVLSDFISLWLGAEYCLDKPTTIIIALNFYVINSTAPIWMVREANGMFEKVKYLMFIRAGVNLALSLLFGKWFGVFGILLATMVSLLTTSVWYEPRIIFKTVFNVGTGFYWKQQVRYVLSSCIALALSALAVSFIPSGMIGFILKVFIIMIIVPVVFYTLNFKTPAMKAFLKFFANTTKKLFFKRSANK